MTDAKNTSPGTTLRVATWSLFLGIIGIPLCIFVVPSLLAIILGIIALIKINNSPVRLPGKGRAVWGIVLGVIASLLIPVVALIGGDAITNIWSASPKIEINEASSIDSLRAISNAENDWKKKFNCYWTYDVSCLYRYDYSWRITGELARADVAPAADDVFDRKLKAKASVRPKNGYLFRAMLEDEHAQPYNQEKVFGAKAANKSKYGFVAYPAKYGKTGKRTFIINEKETVYAVDTGSDANKIVLSWPGADPIKVDGPVAGARWEAVSAPSRGG